MPTPDEVEARARRYADVYRERYGPVGPGRYGQPTPPPRTPHPEDTEHDRAQRRADAAHRD